MPNFRKGAEAIAKAQERSEGGSFRPFTPKIFWQNDGDERWLVFLNPLAEVPTVQLIDFIKQTGKKSNGEVFTYYEEVIARTEPGLDNPADKDPMVEDWKATPKSRNIAVAVEIEPEFEDTRGGRKRPVSFTVKTREFDRKVRDEKGEATDEIETVEQPVWGFVVQSPYNFFNVATSFDAKTAPFEGTPVMVAQVGKGSDVAYTFNGHESLPLDLSDLFETIDGITYLTQDERDELFDTIESLSDEEALVAIGDALLSKRLDELADPERYEELYKSITEEFRQFGGKKEKGSKSSSGRTTRRSRGSQRKAADEGDESPSAVTPEDNAQEPEPEPKAEKTDTEKGKDRLAELRTRSRQRAAK